MLTHLPPLVHKLWDRGVDIGVGVVTSVIVAIIGLCFWRLKLLLDLRADAEKQWQQHDIASKWQFMKDYKAAHQRNDRLCKEREDLAIAVTRAGTNNELAAIWDNYVKWLDANDLQNLPRNLTILTQRPRWAEGLRGSQRGNEWDDTKRTMTHIIRETELP
jgi:hypothetical protein